MPDRQGRADCAPERRPSRRIIEAQPDRSLPQNRRPASNLLSGAAATRCNKAVQPPEFHATNRGTNAGFHIAHNPPSGVELTRSIADRFRWGLRCDDLAPATVRGYRYDLEQFLRWFSQVKGSSSRLENLSILDLINYRQYLVNVEALKPATSC